MLAYSRRNSLPCHASQLAIARRTLHKEAVVELARTDGRAGGAGLFNLVSVVILAVSVLAVGIAAALLARTLAAATSINKKAGVIAQTATGINTATDSVLQLNRTNQTAASILETAKPLEGQVGTIVGLAGDIDGLAKSINGTAGTINGTAGAINTTAGTINATATGINSDASVINGTAATINATAKSINSTAAAILDVAQRIDNDAETITTTLDQTLEVVRLVKVDTGNIVNQAINAEHTAGCIAAKLQPLGQC
jgi:methyl-accepting chemotaxis protein